MKEGRPLPPEWRDPKGPLRERTEQMQRDYQLETRNADLLRRRRPYVIGAFVGIAMTALAAVALLAKACL